MKQYSKDDIIRIVNEEDIEFIRLQFTDIFGQLKNVAVTRSQIEKVLDDKIMIDGSSIEGFTRIHESDQYLHPDLDTFAILPWMPSTRKTARLICNVYNPDGTPFVGDPRYILRRAVEIGVSGLTVGGIDDETLREFLGYDLGVAITGSEKLGLTLIVTEGFGPIAMAERTFALLKRHEGELASISGATQIRAGVIRPEIIIPICSGQSRETEISSELSLSVGAQVRLIRSPHFGALAKVRSLPAELTAIPTGARVRVAEAELPDGTVMLIPRANLEIISG